VIAAEGLGVPFVAGDPQATRISTPKSSIRMRREMEEWFDFIKIVWITSFENPLVIQ
jgi:hypothetical protein